MYEKLMRILQQGGEAPDSGLQEYSDIQQPTEFGGREAPYEPDTTRKANLLQSGFEAGLDADGQATQQSRIRLSPKAQKLLKKKQEADSKLEKELRDQEPVNLEE